MRLPSVANHAASLNIEACFTKGVQRLVRDVLNKENKTPDVGNIARYANGGPNRSRTLVSPGLMSRMKLARLMSGLKAIAACNCPRSVAQPDINRRDGKVVQSAVFRAVMPPLRSGLHAPRRCLPDPGSCLISRAQTTLPGACPRFNVLPTCSSTRAIMERRRNPRFEPNSAARACGRHQSYRRIHWEQRPPHTLSTFNREFYLSEAVALGVAAEALILRMIDSYIAAFVGTQRKANAEKRYEGKQRQEKRGHSERYISRLYILSNPCRSCDASVQSEPERSDPLGR